MPFPSLVTPLPQGSRAGPASCLRHSTAPPTAASDCGHADDSLPVQQFLPSQAAADAGRLFGHDVRPRARGFVADLDEDPALLAGPGQRESPGELAAVQDERDVPRLVPYDLGSPLVPDDHRAAAALLGLANALELARRQGMIFDRHSQPPDTRVE